jgi:hypothetical protein
MKTTEREKLEETKVKERERERHVMMIARQIKRQGVLLGMKVLSI